MTKPARRPTPARAPYPVSWAIFALARTHRGAAAALLAPLGLAPGQELLLFHLWREDGVPQKTLIGLLGLDHSTVAKSVRRLEASGLVTKSHPDYDGRVTLIHLTEAGRALEEPVNQAWSTLEKMSTQLIGAKDARTFVDMAQRIVEGISKD